MKTATENNNNSKYRWIFLVVSTMIILFALFLPDMLSRVMNTSEDTTESTIQVFRSNSGWGYTITAKDGFIIQQPYIPAILGQKSFDSQDQARKTAKMVLEKLNKGKNPSLSLSELDSLGIEY